MGRSKAALWTILAVAMVIRLTVLAIGLRAGGALRTPDSAGYIDTARTLATTGRFATAPDAQPEIVRTPGYPLWLAGLWRATAGGAEIASAPCSSLVPVAGLAQCVLDGVLVYLTYLLGCRLSGPAVGLLAAALQATAPVAVAASVRVLSDGVFSLLLTAAVLCLLHYTRHRRWPALLAAAVVLAISAYVRPIALLVPLVIGAALVRRHLRHVAAFAAVFAACVAPWIVRNYRAAGYPGFSAITAVNLYFYNAAAVRAASEGVGEAEMRRRMRGEFRVHTGRPATAEAYLWAGRQALRICVRQPDLAVGVHLKGALAGLLPGATDVLEIVGITRGQRGTLDVLKRRGLAAGVRHYFAGDWRAAALAIPGGLLLAGVYLGVLVAGAGRLRLRMSVEGWLLLLIVGYFLLVPGPASHPRFRAPVLPVLHVAAACGWMWLFRRKSTRAADSARR